MSVPVCRICGRPSPFGDPCKLCDAIEARNAERGRPLTAREKLENLAEFMEVERLREIADVAYELIYGDGLRLTPEGLIVREKADKSDPHFRLCELLKDHEPGAYAAAKAEAPTRIVEDRP